MINPSEFYFEQFIFSDFLIDHLTSHGFQVQKNIQTNGITESLLPFQNSYLKYLEVIDERELSSKKEALAPQVQPLINKSVLMDKPHPNSCFQISGIYMNPDKEQPFQKNIKIIKALDSDELYNFFILRKIYPLWAIFIQCEDLKKFNQHAKPDKIVHLRGKEFYLMKQNDIGWDLLIHQGELNF